MTFLTWLALGVGVLVVAPYLAHRLRRQRAEDVLFAPARLVPPTPPRARRRAKLEDRALFGIRVASIVALALLGASPLVHCSRLSLSRSGASVAVAIVVDDSMSMRAIHDGKSRFERAKNGGRELLDSLRDGDAAAIVFAGAPARVGLAATTDIAAARAALDAATEADRATDLDGAIAIARTLVGNLPQVDRRVIVLSDLADGKPDAPPIGEGPGVPVWVAMPELREGAQIEDCALITADRRAASIRVRFACSSAEASRGREVEVRTPEPKVVVKAALPQGPIGELSLDLPPATDAHDLTAVLTGADAIASDDRAPVVEEVGSAALAVIGDHADDAVVTGGVPVVERALTALRLDMAVRPLPQAPDRREDAVPFAAMIIDDPPGFTPEQRRALEGWVDHGGMLLLSVGNHAASAPLGANFEPFLQQGVSWSDTGVRGADDGSGAPILGEAPTNLADVAPRGRALLGDADGASLEPLLKWKDGAPFIARKTKGRGEVWIVTLPFSVETSDFSLRPGFLTLLDAFVTEARERASARRSDVGVPWNFVGASAVKADGPAGPVTASRDGTPLPGTLRIVPALAGAYRIDVDEAHELRVAMPIAREVNFKPRAAIAGSTSADLGATISVVDVSWFIALILLTFTALELVTRAAAKPREEPS